MADDTRDHEKEGVATTTAGTTTEPAKKFPKGVVLGKDGKPCRSCTTFANWASNTKKFISGTKDEPQAVARPPADCPPDVSELGRSSWTLLHSITAQYPVTPTETDKNDVKQFMGLFSKLYPCWVCGEHFQAFMVKNKVRVESRDEFGQWMCEAHNAVNRKLGKNEFDCSKWEERWRTGWKDGRCD